MIAHPAFWRRLEEELVFTPEPDWGYLAALYDFDLLNSDDIARLADRLLAGGLVDDELIAINALPDATSGEARRLFERWLKAKGQARLTREDAGLALARVVSRRMLSGATTAFEGGKVIWQDLYNACRALTQLFPFVSDASAYEDTLAMLQRDEPWYLEALLRHARELVGEGPSWRARPGA